MAGMSGKDAHLYNMKKPKSLQGKSTITTSNLGFASNLSSLIATSKTPSTSSAPRPGRCKSRKEDIFSTHNKNTKKRALKDFDEADFQQKHSTSSERPDDATWHRAKRKMEEKARLYAAMKRGDVDDEEGKYGVDFDRKWAEAKQRGDGDDEVSSEESDEDAIVPEDEMIEYTDEYGRLVKGSKAQAAREEMRKAGVENRSRASDDRFTAHPAMPSTLIYGDAIQTHAFNPDAPIAERMDDLARKRDKELTPPPDQHFDGRAEIRSKGVGFFAFSADEEERKKQMANLEKERVETERMRAEALGRKEARKKELEERRKALTEKRTKAQADRFLDGLTGQMDVKEKEKPAQ